ncbi:MAG: COX15/CtaA family protein [Actinomycetota bacterium]|nr:COX15/CtaA family protein [Actinomycetota bacterium]MDA2971319.1 COX15/CtaA family protein [Actinomycetota bacterium]MDA3002371.1 COX15/CtaA family protein [Actinomycetota bacterium]
MKSWTVSPERYTKISIFALILLCVIVVTGAAVRLTGSGLGCEDWPRCNSERVIDVSSTHGAIEQVNRLFTGLVAAGVILAVLAARRRRPYRADLSRLAWGLVAGVIGQVVLGGIVVLTDLHPLANQGHFVLSMILVSNATVLVLRSRERGFTQAVDRLTRRVGRSMVIVGVVAILTGTIVTGSGPHAGDENARRFDLDISSIARLHGASVIASLILLVATIVVARRVKVSWRRMSNLLEGIMAVGLLQGVVGYVQYFNDIPAGLVAVHIAGATAFMIVLTALWWNLSESSTGSAHTVNDRRVTVSS